MAIERIAHRGARTELPENTLAAFGRAFERGANAIELDVHATCDGVVVVHHDPELALPVSVARRAIAEMTWQEVDASRLVTGISVPTLAEVLAMVPHTATVYVEIKGAGIELLVADVIGRSSAHCAVHSFDHAMIERFKRIAPDVPRGLLYEGNAAQLDVEVQRIGAREVWPHFSLVDADLVARTRALGARTIVWTVNDTAEARRLAGLGVDGICTDDVRLLDGLDLKASAEKAPA
jgi:glycerophosphoryl diester phosphodiesterase